MLAGVVLLSYSCSETSAPTPTQMAPGFWNVQRAYVDGQLSGTDFDVFVLERNGRFALEDDNLLIFEGTYTASETALTLSSTEGTVFAFTIIYMDFNRMQLVRTITGQGGNATEFRYFLNRSNQTTYQ